MACTAVLAGTADAATHGDVARAHIRFDHVVKSGTPALMRLLTGDSEEAAAFRAAYSLAERPELDAFADSDDGIFRVHYDLSGRNAPPPEDEDHNGIPDYVDSTLVYLQYAWHLIVVELGYGRPSFDGTLGGLPRDMIDCYLMDLSPQQVYGYTYADGTAVGASSSYMTIDNDFSENIYYTKGYDALKITTAHEFFHVIHYTYFAGMESIWWMEQTAVWMEDRAWDDVNDYLNYIGFLYTERDTPLDSSYGTFMYGASLFAFHIAENYGERMIRSIWQTFKDRQSGEIENLNAVLPDGLAEAISDLAVWALFTGERANGRDFFEEADLIEDTMRPDRMTLKPATRDSLTFRHYTFKYVDIEPDGGFSPGDSLYFDFESRDGGVWEKRLVLFESPYNYEICRLSGDRTAVHVPRPFEKAYLVLANASRRDKYYEYVYRIKTVTAKGVAKEPVPVPFELHQNFPNPFNNSTTISYSVRERSRVTLEVKNIQGATVATLVDEVVHPGLYSVVFDARGLSSGTYFVVLESGGTTTKKKMMLLK